MHLHRLAYSTIFLLAVIAIFTLWAQVGGQSHLDLVPWYLKFVLGLSAALACTKAAAAATGQDSAWTGRTLRWLGILLALLCVCGMASYYAHLYYEDDTGDEEQPEISALSADARIVEVDEVFALRGAGDSGLRPNLCRLGSARLRH